MESGHISGLSREDLDLDATLSSGQVFRWSRDGAGVWCGCIEKRAARLWCSEDSTLYWEADGPDAEAAVRDFLRLDVDLPVLAATWKKRDSYFADAWTAQPGIRVLRQDPEECFFSFLCASVAPIGRISKMLRGVADTLGEKCTRDGRDPTCWTPFPDAACIAKADEAFLRGLGLGFRALRVKEAAQALTELPSDHLTSLRAASHEEAKQALMRFFGVGEKIADCICLFSLDKDAAVPVDTHIWRIARARYAPELADSGTLTPAAYARVGEAFRETFGEYAGWAQQTLFYRSAVLRNGG